MKVRGHRNLHLDFTKLKTNNNTSSDMIEDLDSPMSGLTRGKLDSTSRESRASDSGISAEFSCDSNNLPLSTTQNGVSVSNVNTVTSNNTHCSDRLPSGGSASDTSIGDIHINGAHDASLEAATIDLHITETEDDVDTPYYTPEQVESDNLTLPNSRAASLSPRHEDRGNSGRYSTLSSLTAPPPSMIDGSSAQPSGPSSADLSPYYPESDSAFGFGVVSNILERLMSDQLKRDSHWEPSGRYNMAAGHRQSLVHMEDDIGKTMNKRHKAREDARRVLELFLEASLTADPEYKPSEHYSLAQSKKHQTSVRDKQAKFDFTSDSSSPPVPLQPLSPVIITLPHPPSARSSTINTISAAGVLPRARPLSPIESAAERSSDLSGLHTSIHDRSSDYVNHQRDSYYNALYDDTTHYSYDDGCFSAITEEIPSHVGLGEAEVATPESLGKTTDDSPISLIALGDTKETTFGSHDKIKQTEVERTADGDIHIHTHTEISRPLSSSTSLSSILDDGGQPSVDIRNRKKKSFFTKASERLRHALHRVQRSDSKSETELEKYSVKPRPRKLKKKKKVIVPLGGSSRRKSPIENKTTDWKVLQTHKHQFQLKGNAHVDGAAKHGLNADIWREGECDGVKDGIVSKGKASTLPIKSASDQKHKDKAKEKKDKEMKELIEQAKKNRKADRSESGRSSESLFKRFSTKINNRIDSPGATKSDRKNSFSFNSLIRRPKKKSSQEAADSRSPTPLQHPTTSASSESKHFSDEKLTSGSLNADTLQLPESQQRSKSAEELPSPRTGGDNSSTTAAKKSFPPRLAPQHSRSRSAQDSTATSELNGFETGRISPVKLRSSARRATVDSPGTEAKRRHYVPRSSPTKLHTSGPYRPQAPRRHTTQVEQSDVTKATGYVNVISSAGVRKPTPSRGGRRSQEGRPMSPAGPPIFEISPAGAPMRRVSRDGLDLPLSVEGNVTRTQSMSTRNGGHKVIRTVTSMDEMVKLMPGKRARRTTSEVETDSEIEQLIKIPAVQRSQSQRDLIYGYIAAKMVRMVRHMEESGDDGGISSAFNTPMEEMVGGIYPAGSAPSSTSHRTSSLGRNSSSLSSKTTSSTSPHGSLREGRSAASPRVVASPRSAASPAPPAMSPAVAMADIMETSGADGGDGAEGAVGAIPKIKPTSVSELGQVLRDKGDNIQAYNPNLSAMFGNMMMQNLGSYEGFSQAVENVSGRNDWGYTQKIAAVFGLTLKAVRYVGKTGELASRIKENALTYLEDKFASYIIGNGGWDSMIEESSSEWDVD